MFLSKIFLSSWAQVPAAAARQPKAFGKPSLRGQFAIGPWSIADCETRLDPFTSKARSGHLSTGLFPLFATDACLFEDALGQGPVDVAAMGIGDGNLHRPLGHVRMTSARKRPVPTQRPEPAD